MIELKYFQLSEFDAKDEPGTGRGMKESTLRRLDKMREIYGGKITVRHGFRTKRAAARIKANYAGAVKNSAHEIGYAADIAPTSVKLKTWASWFKFLEAAWAAGFRRFGIMNNTLHVDDDPKRPSPAIWDYTTTDPATYKKAWEWFKIKRDGDGNTNSTE